jgi:hypothetical protein
MSTLATLYTPAGAPGDPLAVDMIRSPADPRKNIALRAVEILGTLLLTAMAPNTTPFPVGTPSCEAALEVMAQQGPQAKCNYVNLNTSQSSSPALIFPQVPPQLMQKEPWRQADSHKRLALSNITATVSALELYPPAAATTDQPRSYSVNRDSYKRSVVDTTQGSNVLSYPPLAATSPVWQETNNATANYPLARLYQPADTSHSWPYFYYGDGDGADPLWQNDQTASFIQTPRILSNTSQGTPPVLNVAVAAPFSNPASVPVDRVRWQPLDTSKSWPYFYYGDGDGADPLWASNALLSKIDRAQQTTDTTHGTPLVLTVAVAAPFSPAASLLVDRVRWQPADTSRSWPHFYEGDGDGLDPFWQYEQQTAPDRVRPVADTSQGAFALVNAPVLPPVPTNLQQPAPQRFQFQPADTSRSTGKALYSDATTPFFIEPHTAPDRVRPVADTSQSVSEVLLPAPPPLLPPGQATPQSAPQRVWFQPADTSQSSAKATYADTTLPVQDYQQTPPDRVRAVADTSQSAYALINAPAPTAPAGQATPQSAPQRFQFQPADTSQSTGKALYGDATTPFFVEPHTAPDKIRQVSDTGRGFVALDPVGARQLASAPERPRQSYDTSQGSPALLTAVTSPVGAAQTASAPERPRQSYDTSQATPKALYGDATTPFFVEPHTTPDRVRPVADTSQSTQLSGYPPPPPPGQATPQSAPLRYGFQPADTTRGVPKALYADATTPFFVEPHTAPDRIHPVTDTTQLGRSPQSLVPLLPFFNPPWATLQPLPWQIFCSVYDWHVQGTSVLWTQVADGQAPGWAPVINGQTPGWAAVGPVQTPGWAPAGSVQVPGWTAVSDPSSPGWTAANVAPKDEPRST